MDQSKNEQNLAFVNLFKNVDDKLIDDKLNLFFSNYQSLSKFNEPLENHYKNLENFKKSLIGNELKVSDINRLNVLYQEIIKCRQTRLDYIEENLKIAYEYNRLKNEQTKHSLFVLNKYSANHIFKLITSIGTSIPLWMGKGNPPPLCGAIQPPFGFIPPTGHLIAVRTLVKNTKEWILAIMIEKKNAKEIIALDMHEKNTLSVNIQNSMIPLPIYRANPKFNPEALFQLNELVLALYPNTTCFYPAKVYHPPEGPNEMYKILFYDDYFAENFSPPMDISQSFVIKWPEGQVPPNSEIKRLKRK